MTSTRDTDTDESALCAVIGSLGPGTVEAVVQGQVKYYRARAGEYDAAYEERMGMRSLHTVLSELPICGDVVELACGTGQWSLLIAPRAASLTVVDASPEMLTKARARLAGQRVEFVQANVLDWSAPRQYDTVFFAFWLSHVPASLFDTFWAMVDQALAPGGSVVFLDDARKKAEIERYVGSREDSVVCRTLADGSEHLVVKVLHEPEALELRLGVLGWDASVRAVDEYHIAGVATRRSLSG